MYAGTLRLHKGANQAGAATQREVLTENLVDNPISSISETAETTSKRKRGKAYGVSGYKASPDLCRSDPKRDIKNYALMSALYLLTADLKLWNVARRYMEGNSIHFSKIKLCGIHPDGYTLFCGAKDLYLGTKHLSVGDLSDPELITHKCLP